MQIYLEAGCSPGGGSVASKLCINPIQIKLTMDFCTWTNLCYYLKQSIEFIKKNWLVTTLGTVFERNIISLGHFQNENQHFVRSKFFGISIRA